MKNKKKWYKKKTSGLTNTKMICTKNNGYRVDETFFYPPLTYDVLYGEKMRI